jgi:AraC family transcriptional regulator of adaptative response/methylated-DNA-[protein]-cysteine methyltransferase
VGDEREGVHHLAVEALRKLVLRKVGRDEPQKSKPSLGVSGGELRRLEVGGVRTTGVYCRCVCPVRLPFRRNIEFLPSAAAAEVAGFRPCLRCRPEAAPFSPAWNGTRTTVERAARLIIEDGALDGGTTVEDFAARLGMTARHLNRLFVQHWGASPSVVARTARVQRAKRLLTETELPMVEVALQAGFGSLRRFNAVFSEVYKRPPGAIRRRCPPSHL